MDGQVIDEMLPLTSHRYPYGQLENGIKDALESSASCIEDRLMAYGVGRIITRRVSRTIRPPLDWTPKYL